MQTVGCRFWLLVLAQCFALGSPLRAQSADMAKKEEKPSGRAPQAVERVEPDIYYIRDETGELVPLLNHTLEEIKRLLELRDGAAAGPRPGFRLERLVVRGEAAGGNAALSIELTIAASDAGWVRVPLRLGELVLTELAVFGDEGEHFVDFEADAREYVAWFRGRADEPHRLTLHGLAPLENDGPQTRLRLHAPRAVFSELELNVPLAEAAGQVASGGVLAETKQVDGRTRFRATGLANDFALSWHGAEARPADAQTVFSVEGRIVSEIEDRGVDTQATLEVTAFGREFSGFKVRLPRGAALLPTDQPDYTVSEIAVPADASDEQRRRKMVEVRLKAKTTSPVHVTLLTKQGHDVGREGTFELGGFDVVGAVRQSGYLAVQAKDDWQVAFLGRQGVLQTDELPADMQRDGVVAGFAYFGQSYTLPARISPRQTRVSVEPIYVVEVGPHHLQLDATLKYRIAGAKVFTISIELGDWQLDRAHLEQAPLVNGAALVFGAGNSVLAPLKQPMTGDLELKIRARMPIAAEAESIAFALPRPAADTIDKTELAVLPDDNVVLTPRTDEMSGLSSAPPDPAIKSSGQRQSPWFYRSDAADPRFAADFQVASRRITNRAETQITLSGGAAEVEQKLISTVFHEAADSLLLLMPQSLARMASIDVRWRDMPLPMTPAAPSESQSGESQGDELAGMRVRLPEPQLGPIELAISYVWEGESLDGLLSRAATANVEIPLIMPGEGEFTGGRLTLLAEPRLQIGPAGEAWKLEETAREGDQQRLVFSSSQPYSNLALSVHAAEGDASQSLVVERAWVQTWLTDSQRLDRAVFRFRSQDHRCRLRLPPGRSNETFRLDGEPVLAAPRGDALDERLLSLPANDVASQAHVLEVTYGAIERSNSAGRISLELPELLGAASARQVYWQLVLPRNEYLVQGPKALANDFIWLWKGFGWSRQPLRDTSELEVWSGAHEREGPLPPSVNAYLFTGLAPPGEMRIATVSRQALVLGCSGTLLAAGLLWLYLPALRRSAWLFAAGVGVLATAAVWPDLAILAAQAAVIGALLALLAGALERRFGRRPSPVAFRGGSSSIVRRSSTHTHPRGAAPAPASTQTAAMAVEMGAEAES